MADAGASAPAAVPAAGPATGGAGAPGAGTRFADVRRFAEIDSTNRYVLEEARAGAPEGLVAVADHQSAGRGRRGRTWVAPPGSALMLSVLLRPSLGAGEAHLLAVAVAVAAAEACDEVAGLAPALKWPNDLVVPAPGGAGDRKLGGVLAEADVRGDRLGAVVVGVGLNLDWPSPPPELAAVAVALAQAAGRPVDREALLGALLSRLDASYGRLLATPDGRDDLAARYRRRCATLGRRVRVDLGAETLVGRAVDVTAEGHLVVATDGGDRRTLAVGDVVHLR